MTGSNVRASDADREQAVTLLQREVGTGRLTLDEFSERSAAAYQARTVGDLATLTSDLPRTDPAPTPRTLRIDSRKLMSLALLLGIALLAFAGPLAAGAMAELTTLLSTTCH
ncbi:DUF1707 SHOCT-like domain-containing protein [Amycolatopsis palatopharyngis]|uniref:DUF1707 SHOCT-like domain-containing protein n=1 Tax=Amycolatopsis palatopharyngis TaxID=187982 RepID=UPI000E227A9E|nr:DUF1707 domain-containing protein [Amycolatopsis palatopharyngis]